MRTTLSEGVFGWGEPIPSTNSLDGLSELPAPPTPSDLSPIVVSSPSGGQSSSSVNAAAASPANAPTKRPLIPPLPNVSALGFLSK